MLNILNNTIYSTIQYEAISLPPKLLLKNSIENHWPSLKRREFSTQELKNHKNQVVLVATVSCVIMPIIEEFLFRGAVQSSIEWMTSSNNAGIIGSSILFGLAHYFNSNNPADVLFQLADCYFLYNPLRASNGLMASSTAHSIHNLIQFIPFFKKTFF